MSGTTRHNLTIRERGSRLMVLKRGLGCDQNVRRHVSPVFENDWHIVLFDHVAGAKVIQS